MKIDITPLKLTNKNLTVKPKVTELQVSVSPEFESGSIIRSYSGAYATTVEVEDITDYGTFYIRARHKDEDWDYSPWSDAINIIRASLETPAIFQSKALTFLGSSLVVTLEDLKFTGYPDRAYLTEIQVAKDENFTNIVKTYQAEYITEWTYTPSSTGQYFIRARHKAEKLGYTKWSNTVGVICVVYVDKIFKADDTITIPYSGPFRIEVVGGGGGAGISMYDDNNIWITTPATARGTDTIVTLNGKEKYVAKGGRSGDSYNFYNAQLLQVPGIGETNGLGYDPYGLGGYGISSSINENYNAVELKSAGGNADYIHVDMELYTEGDVINVTLGKGGSGVSAYWETVADVDGPVTVTGASGTDGYVRITSLEQ